MSGAVKVSVCYYVRMDRECCREYRYTIPDDFVRMVKLLCLDYSHEEVAQKLQISPRTVNSRMASLYKHYNVRSKNRFALMNLMVIDELLTLPITEADV